jgi:hypothetical protein
MKMMYFNEKEFSPRYGLSFFTVKMFPYDRIGTQLVNPRTDPRTTLQQDAVPPGITNMFSWIVEALGFECCDSGPYIQYRMEVRCSRQTWIVNKRYSEFVSLVKSIQAALPPGVSILAFDLMPPKGSFGRDLSPVFVRDRHARLCRFMDSLLSEMSLKGLLNTNNIITDWLEFDGGDQRVGV